MNKKAYQSISKRLESIQDELAELMLAEQPKEALDGVLSALSVDFGEWIKDNLIKTGDRSHWIKTGEIMRVFCWHVGGKLSGKAWGKLLKEHGLKPEYYSVTNGDRRVTDGKLIYSSVRCIRGYLLSAPMAFYNHESEEIYKDLPSWKRLSARYALDFKKE